MHEAAKMQRLFKSYLYHQTMIMEEELIDAQIRAAIHIRWPPAQPLGTSQREW
jgi:hypothetical protein